MYCSNCGKKIADSSKFCSFCGANLKTGESESGGTDITEESKISGKAKVEESESGGAVETGLRGSLLKKNKGRSINNPYDTTYSTVSGGSSSRGTDTGVYGGASYERTDSSTFGGASYERTDSSTFGGTSYERPGSGMSGMSYDAAGGGTITFKEFAQNYTDKKMCKTIKSCCVVFYIISGLNLLSGFLVTALAEYYDDVRLILDNYVGLLFMSFVLAAALTGLAIWLQSAYSNAAAIIILIFSLINMNFLAAGLSIACIVSIKKTRKEYEAFLTG